MIEQEISLAEAAEAIQEPVSTARRWCGQLPLPGIRQGTRGAWRISTEGLEVVKKVQQLRNAGRGMESIRVVLGPVLAPGERPATAERSPSASPALDVQDLVAQVGAVAAAQVVEVIERNNQLAAAYGHAQHKVGALEERLRQLEAERERSPGANARARGGAGGLGGGQGSRGQLASPLGRPAGRGRDAEARNEDGRA